MASLRARGLSIPGSSGGARLPGSEVNSEGVDAPDPRRHRRACPWRDLTLSGVAFGEWWSPRAPRPPITAKPSGIRWGCERKRHAEERDPAVRHLGRDLTAAGRRVCPPPARHRGIFVPGDHRL